jgi:hypothetical protein
MKSIVLGSVIFLASNAFAIDMNTGGKGEHFAEMKTQVLQHLDEELAILQQTKSCVSSAADHEALKQCREQKQQAKKQERIQNIDHRMQKLQEMKAKISTP